MSVGAVAVLLVAVSLASALLGAMLTFPFVYELARHKITIANLVVSTAMRLISRAKRLEAGSMVEEVAEINLPGLRKFQLIFRGIA